MSVTQEKGPIMADKPIIFSAPMVKALLDGRKTQTRRVLSLRGYKGFHQFGVSDTAGYDWTFRRADWVWEDFTHERLLQLLPYAIGDRLWVRESHYLTDDGDNEYVVFAADQKDVDDHLAATKGAMARWPTIDWSKHLKLRPPIHMPRWASRLTLTVTDVRVQRLQDISEVDAVAEGIFHRPIKVEPQGLWTYAGINGGWHEPVSAYRALWNSLHGPEAWEANPWIVALTFSVQRGNIDKQEADHG